MESEFIEARFSNYIYQSPDGSYSVASFYTKDNDPIVVTGKLDDLQPEMPYKLAGQYSWHPKHGKQFKCDIAMQILPKKKDHVLSFLSSSRFPGIGKKTAQKIIDTLGEDALLQIRENPDLLEEEVGLKPDKAATVIAGLSTFNDYSDLVLRLLQYGIPVRKTEMLMEYYDNVENMLKDDCFDPLYRVPGFGYEDVSRLADGLKVPDNDLRRLKASIYNWLRRQIRQTGWTYYPLPEFYKSFSNVPWNEFAKALQELELDRLVIVEKNNMFLKQSYLDEWTIAKQLKAHSYACEQIPDEMIAHELERFEKEYAITLDPIQRQAVHTFFKEPVMILNGGPGTGKSTTVKAILQLTLIFFPKLNIQLAAPTGKAAKRLSELSDVPASTIHSLLKWEMDRNRFNINAYNPLDAGFLIIDEASMVDAGLFANLLNGLEKKCRILIIGDEDQLESVSPGNVLSDLIDSNMIPVVSLKTLFRQAEGSGIASLAEEIRENKPLHYLNGVEFRNMEPEEVRDFIRDYAQNASFQDSLQVLAPKYAGISGIDSLNTVMQEALNPPVEGKPEIKISDVSYREGDKVMLTKNHKSLNVFNGDIGYISKVNDSAREFTVVFDTEEVTFSYADIGNFTHAWAVSIHKSQGSEYQQVLCSIPSDAFLLTKKMVYTAISRAKKKLIILGDRRTFETAIFKTRSTRRKTMLKQRMIDAFNGKNPFI